MKYILIRHNVHVNSLNPLAFISMNASKLKERERERISKARIICL